MTQKFHKGDRVHINDEMPSWMAHFPAGKDGTVVGSYRDQYPQLCSPDYQGGYTINIDNMGAVSWYDEEQLTKIEYSLEDINAS